MTLETKALEYPVYTVGPGNEIGIHRDATDGTHLGLLFTGREEARRFKQRNHLGAEVDIQEIITETQLVQMARRLRKDCVDTLVFDYGVFGDKVTTIPVDELCRRHIPGDD